MSLIEPLCWNLPFSFKRIFIIFIDGNFSSFSLKIFVSRRDSIYIITQWVKLRPPLHLCICKFPSLLNHCSKLLLLCLYS